MRKGGAGMAKPSTGSDARQARAFLVPSGGSFPSHGPMSIRAHEHEVSAAGHSTCRHGGSDETPARSRQWARQRCDRAPFASQDPPGKRYESNRGGRVPRERRLRDEFAELPQGCRLRGLQLLTHDLIGVRRRVRPSGFLLEPGNPKGVLQDVTADRQKRVTGGGGDEGTSYHPLASSDWSAAPGPADGGVRQDPAQCSGDGPVRASAWWRQNPRPADAGARAPWRGDDTAGHHGSVAG